MLQGQCFEYFRVKVFKTKSKVFKTKILEMRGGGYLIAVLLFARLEPGRFETLSASAFFVGPQELALAFHLALQHVLRQKVPADKAGEDVIR